MSLLRLSAVTRRFDGFTANDEVTFHVDEGEVVGLLGANGAGKTTAIRQALGLLAPTSGVVTQFGGVPTRHTRKRIGYVPQSLGLWSDLSLEENLQFTAHAYGSDTISIPADLEGQADTLFGGLSLGRQRRAAFSAALEHEPELLVLDEPTSGVDALSRSQLWDVIRARAEDAVGVLVTTHFMDEAQQCDRLLIMNRGRIVLQGRHDEIVGDRSVVQVDGPAWPAIFGALDGAGFRCGLIGRSVRVLTDDEKAVKSALVHAGLDARLSTEPATLEETMVSVTRSPDPD